MLWISEDNLQLPLYSTNVTPDCVLNICPISTNQYGSHPQQRTFALQETEANTEKHS